MSDKTKLAELRKTHKALTLKYERDTHILREALSESQAEVKALNNEIDDLYQDLAGEDA